MRFILKLIDNNRYRLLILFLTTCAVSYLCLCFFYESLPAIGNHRAFVRAGLVDKLIITFDETATSDQEINNLSNIISDVKALEDVDDLSTFLPREIFLYDKSTDKTFLCDIYEQIHNENYRFELSEGRLPQKGTNEVLISEDGKNAYRLGDVIHTEILDEERHYNADGELDHIESKYSQPAELTVVGILKNGSDILSPYPGPSPIDLFGRKVTESSSVGLPLIISYGCKDLNGDPLEHDYGDHFQSQVLVVKLNGDHSVSEAKEHIAGLVHGFGNVSTGYEIIETDINSKWVIFRPYIVYGSVVLFLMTITMVSMYIFQIKRGMKALISYYICGSTWKNIIAKICLINIFVTVLGYFCGLIFVKIMTSPFDDFVLPRSAKFITLILILLIQLITSLAFFLSVYRISPVDIKRREDE